MRSDAGTTTVYADGTPPGEPQQLHEGEMDASTKEKPVADLRYYLAEERTFLAWIRTGIALMGFGLVVAQFELFADEPQITRHASGIHPHGPSLWFGTALVAIGVAVHLFSLVN
jgi:putative membrane protein